MLFMSSTTKTLTVTRGLPGSGKTTWAKIQPEVRISRDDLRDMCFGQSGILSVDREDTVTVLEQALASAALNEGKSVIIDAMHLRPHYLKEWNKFAQRHGAQFKIKVFDTDIETCIKRDAKRERTLGEDVIRGIAHKGLKGGKTFHPYTPLEQITFEPYARKRWVDGRMLDHTVIVDIDGTMTMGPKNRGAYDWSKVSNDEPRQAMQSLIGNLLDNGYHITFLSGRDSVCREETIQWIKKHIATDGADRWDLYMRPEGDKRPDVLVKYELFNNHLRDQWFVGWVHDDRPAVCRMWREIGLDVLQCGNPHEEF